uniref:Uncharacterized protein n=1 Tax=Salix viminalis TaxID=40686 RepID=A0A6N2KM23_SALVM
MGGDKLGGLERKERRRELCSDSHISAGHPHYCLASYRRDCNYLPPFEKPDHLKISGNPLKPVGVAGQFLHRPPLDFSDFLVSCISLYYLHDDLWSFHTVGSSLLLSIVFALVVTTYSPKGFQSEPPAIFASYHRWMKLKFGYVVLLSVINVLNGGDEELIVQQGDMYVEQ